MRSGRSLSYLLVLGFVIRLNVVICTTTTPDLSPTSDAIVTTPDPVCTDDTCLNNGTCRELEDWECSNDPNMLPSICVCTESFTGDRCEFSTSCGGTICGDNEQCTLNGCTTTNASTSELAVPVCQGGVHPLTYKLDMLDRRKPVVCLDMYYTTNDSYCYDDDDSIEFQIVEEEVTLQATENRFNPRNDTIVFSVTFNEAPFVNTTSRSYILNMAKDVSPYVINVQQDFKVSDDDTLEYRYKGTQSGTSIDSSSGQLMFGLQIGILSIDIEIKDNGIPRMETVINVRIEVVRLSCYIHPPVYVNYKNIGNIVGKLRCDTSDGFEMSDLQISYTTNGDLQVEITPSGLLRVIQGSLGSHNVSTEFTLAKDSGQVAVSVDFILLVAYIRTSVFALSKRTWSPFFAIQTSPNFTALRSEVTQQIKDELNKVPDVIVNIEIFSEGSVYVHFTMLFTNEENATYATDQLNASIANNGTVGYMEVNRTSYIFSNQVGLVLISRMVYSSPDTPTNTPVYTRNNTQVQLTCTGTFVQPVGDVTMEWRMTSSEALVVPLSYSRLQTSFTSPSTGVYEGTLTASNILFRDKGPFTCVLKDETGRSGMKRRTVNVVARPVVTLLPLKNVFVKPGESVMLKCNVTESATADTNITWYRNGEDIQTGQSIFSTFTVPGNIGSDANYTCRGENNVGRGDESGVTSVYTIQPAIIRCDEEGAWQATQAGITVEVPCTGGETGVMSRSCSVDGSWMEVNRSQCVSSTIEKVLDDIEWIEDGVQVANVSTVAETLSANTKPADLGSKEIGLVSESLNRLLNISKESNITENKNETKQFTKSFVASASNILDSTTVDKWKNVQESQTTPTTVIELVDNVTEVAADSLDDGEVETFTSPNIAVQVGKRSPITIEDIVFPEQGPQNNTLTISSSLILTSEALEKLPGNTSVRFSAIYYKNISSLLPAGTELQKPAGDGLSDNSSSDMVVNGDILAFNLFPPLEEELDPPLKMTFTHTNESLDSATGQCAFLNISTGLWQTDGCIASVRAENYTECSCRHLTTFALLMSPRITGEKQTPLLLTIITKAGCGISVVFLVLTVILYGTVWRYVKSDQATVLIHICVCLAIAMLLFMFGVDQIQYKAVCTIIAVALHFFYMASFFMMLASALETLWSVVLVFATRPKLRPLLIGAWVMSVAVVTVSMAATKLEGYGTSQHCWLSLESNLRWAFIGPVLVIVAVNFIIIGKLIHTMLSTRALQNVNVKKKIKKSLRGICILIPVLGVSWILGVLSVEDEQRVMEYTFAIINSLQGLFIFITQCLMKKKFRSGLANYKRRFMSSRSLQSSQQRKKSHPQDETEGSRNLASQQNLLPFHSISEDPLLENPNPDSETDHRDRDGYVAEHSGAYDNNVPDQPPQSILPSDITSSPLLTPDTPVNQRSHQTTNVSNNADVCEVSTNGVKSFSGAWAEPVVEIDTSPLSLFKASVDVDMRINEWLDQYEYTDRPVVGNRSDGTHRVIQADILHETDRRHGTDLLGDEQLGRDHGRDYRRQEEVAAVDDPSHMTPHRQVRPGKSLERGDGHRERRPQQPADMRVSDWLASNNISPAESSSQLYPRAPAWRDVSSLMDFIPYGVRGNASSGGGRQDAPFRHPGFLGYTSHENLNTLQDRPFSRSMNSFNSLI